MDNSGMYVGLDIGTTSIKVIVAENVKGQMNVIGVGNERSNGVSRGVIVDIDKAAEAIQRAVRQAEEKASIEIHDVIVGIPANMLKIEPCSGMIAIDDQSREITGRDVRSVATAALIQSLPPEREVVDILADEFVVDGFDGIKDPRGMVGVRLELHGTLFTGPKTIMHNTRKAVEQGGLHLRGTVINPMAQGMMVMNDGEQDFGTVLIDLGGGQATAAVIHDHQLKYVDVDQEGGQFITKDISVVLNTSLDSAEKLKRDYGYADSTQASDEDEFPVDVVGQSQPTPISEKYLAEIIEARLDQIFKRLRANLDKVQALELPGGIVLTGGVAALPGITDLATDEFNTNVRVYVPDQMGLRHPSFTLALALVNYYGGLSEIDLLIKSALTGSTQLADETDEIRQREQVAEDAANEAAPVTQGKSVKPKQKKNRTEGIKKFFSDFFD
ncbi:cell division protein FtsA [Levilactobacillus brevis]|uniref:cell division protein FtsA n=1 Tax=Levilactobacillus brevis TaxID=1580 RepID=UPI001C1E9CA5|nr:cell division protein FtsA [Levilactobacillus brevis]MBU7538670.1 cell division protein FtsA [Levilactobacillus brevis]MBU7558311.1 cell division protein FtsA [Levilactobacillus brevis]MBU7564875.1 cell division protein FtsA [Levilactobacillus brevis]MCE6009882.1 cell division protein FtsA [Levilactobacillus brevis]MCE6012199.1 cell division protein FtsA [Levilactobacillus brevis]